MSDLVRRSDVLDILGNVFATTLNVEVDVAIAAMMSKIKYMPKVEPDDTTEAHNKGLEEGRNEAWEFVRKLTTLVGDGGMSVQEWESIYKTKIDRIVDEYTPQEALAKLEAYEKEQNVIKVGDIVKDGNDETEFVVIATSTETINRQPILRPIGKTLITGVVFGSDRDLKKTGKHIDIQSVLQQIGGGSDD